MDVEESLALPPRPCTEGSGQESRKRPSASPLLFGRAPAWSFADTMMTRSVDDWDGGTRIGETLHRFNVDWARRVLGQGAVVLLVTDGLDREAGDGVEPEITRLHRQTKRLIWLNPLLRYDGFEPKSLGIRALLPHVDEFRPVHNIKSLTALVEALSGEPDRVKTGKKAA